MQEGYKIILRVLVAFVGENVIDGYNKRNTNDEGIFCLVFKNGCVIEKVRLRYRNDYVAFKRDSDLYQPDFSEKEYRILKLIVDIFGYVSAKELSEIKGVAVS